MDVKPVAKHILFVTFKILIRMKFIVTSSLLHRNLIKLSTVIPSSPIISIINNFLFVVRKEMLILAATDLETYMTASLEITSTEEFSFCVPAKKMLDLLYKVPDQPLTFHITSLNNAINIEITGDAGKYKIACEDTKSFPKEPIEESEASFQLSTKKILRVIRATTYALAENDIRPALAGLLLKWENDTILFAATDTHRLIEYSFYKVEHNNNISTQWVIPKKALTIIKHVFSDIDVDAIVQFSKGHIHIKVSGIVFKAQLINAKYPDYRVAIPQKNLYQCIVNRVALLRSIATINILANKSTNEISVTFKDQSIFIEGLDNDYHNEGNEEIPCQYDGNSIKFAFHSERLMEVLEGIDVEEIRIDMSYSNRALIITPAQPLEDESVLQLIMPLINKVKEQES